MKVEFRQHISIIGREHMFLTMNLINQINILNSYVLVILFIEIQLLIYSD